MSLADSAERQHEPHIAFRRARLVGVDYHARIEQRRTLEGIFLAEIRADQERLATVDCAGVDQQPVHFMISAQENRFDVAMPLGQSGYDPPLETRRCCSPYTLPDARSVHPIITTPTVECIYVQPRP